jgi:hypothetical protein
LAGQSWSDARRTDRRGERLHGRRGNGRLHNRFSRHVVERVIAGESNPILDLSTGHDVMAHERSRCVTNCAHRLNGRNNLDWLTGRHGEQRRLPYHRCARLDDQGLIRLRDDRLRIRDRRTRDKAEFRGGKRRECFNRFLSTIVCVGLFKKPTDHPHHRLDDDPHFRSDALSSFSHLRATAAVASPKCLNNLHNSLVCE